MPDNSFEAALAQVNREFYRQAPQTYFQRRIFALALMSGRPDLVRDALAEGVEVGKARFSHDAWPVDDDDQAGYLAVESEVLLYHAVEALLRLLLAHYPRGGSIPALNLASVTSHRDFYRRVRAAFIDSTDAQLDLLIERTIHGFQAPENMPDLDDPRFTVEAALEGKANLREFLRYFATFVLEDDHRFVNNAAKHGLAVRHGHHGFRLGGGTPEQPPLIDQSGDAVGCIVVIRDPTSGEQRVEQVTVWSNPERNFGLLHVVLDIMDSLWSIGRALHLDEKGWTIRLFDQMSLSQMRQITRATGPSTGEGPAFVEMPHMRWPLPIALGDKDDE